MASVKRKIPDLGLQRRVRPRVEPEPESDVEWSGSEGPSEEGLDSAGSEDENQEEDDDEDESSDENASDSGQESELDSDDDHPAGVDVSQLSFGALARAQAALPPARRKGVTAAERGASAENDEADDVKKGITTGDGRKSGSGFPSKPEKIKRTSKHAPLEMSSKKQVSRKRDFVQVPKVEARDPRFMPIGQQHQDEMKLKEAYAFLEDYRKDELRQLKDAAKKEKDSVAKEKLQRAIISMESQMKARARKEREHELLAGHRKKEKELVKQGKQPYYLKKSEQKQKLLIDQFSKMKKGQVDKAIERRRKKVEGKEKKHLPWARRTAEERE